MEMGLTPGPITITAIDPSFLMYCPHRFWCVRLHLLLAEESRRCPSSNSIPCPSLLPADLTSLLHLIPPSASESHPAIASSTCPVHFYYSISLHTNTTKFHYHFSSVSQCYLSLSKMFFLSNLLPIPKCATQVPIQRHQKLERNVDKGRTSSSPSGNPLCVACHPNQISTD